MAKQREIRYRFEQSRMWPRNGAVGSKVRAPLSRITRLMALAISLDDQMCNSSAMDADTLARFGTVSRTRMTQILNLLLLAPDIQEQLLNLPTCARGREPITEAGIRQLACEYDWERQRRVF